MTSGISEGIADLWQELGVSEGTAIVVLIALYLVVKSEGLINLTILL